MASFAREAGVPAWKLRDARQQAAARKAQQAARQDQLECIRDLALRHPTYGYRRVHQQLQEEQPDGACRPGRHAVRLALAALDLNPSQPRKTRKPPVAVLPAMLWPEGRRVQIDATRFSLGDGVCWAYVVLDVPSRAVLNVSVVRSLSSCSAVSALQDGVAVLRELGIDEPLVVMSDGGSDFTSHGFQAACGQLGCWVRARVSQPGGMGILERVNRTLKHEFVFREEVNTKAELSACCVQFRDWYNTARLHSALGYSRPWAKLLEAAKSRNAA